MHRLLRLTLNNSLFDTCVGEQCHHPLAWNGKCIARDRAQTKGEHRTAPFSTPTLPTSLQLRFGNHRPSDISTTNTRSCYQRITLICDPLHEDAYSLQPRNLLDCPTVLAQKPMYAVIKPAFAY